MFSMHINSWGQDMRGMIHWRLEAARVATLATVAILLTVTATCGEPIGGNASGKQKRQLIREGEQLRGRLGEFRDSGGRITFYPEGSESPLYLLENLALERVSTALENQAAKRVWSVTGVITEFRGENYLLLQRAIMTTRGDSR